MLGILKLLAAAERGIAMRTVVSAWDVSLSRRRRPLAQRGWRGAC